MISRTQMKIDLIGQAILLLLCISILIFSQNTWKNIEWGLGILLAWQVASAAYYWYNYKYQERRPVFWMLSISLISIFFVDLAIISSILLGIAVLGYLYLTLRDTLRVYRRPKSFWDLG